MARTKKVKNEAPVNQDCAADAPVVESTSDAGTPPASFNEETKMTDSELVPEGYTHTMNPTAAAEPTKQEIAAAKAQAKITAKAEKAAAAADAKALRELAKAEKQAAKDAISGATKEERAAAHAERQARIAALGEGRKYVGSMLSLADRVKQGVYVKSSTGQLRSTDGLAEALDAVPVMNVIALAKIVLELDSNPYSALNTGQQSMNLRNKMRGAITKGTLTLDRVKEVIAEEGFATAVDWAAEKAAKAAAREAKAAEAKAEKAEKAAAKAAAKEAEAVPA